MKARRIVHVVGQDGILRAGVYRRFSAHNVEGCAKPATRYTMKPGNGKGKRRLWAGKGNLKKHWMAA